MRSFFCRAFGLLNPVRRYGKMQKTREKEGAT